MVLDFGVYLTVIGAIKFVPRYTVHVIGPHLFLFSSFILHCDLWLCFYYLFSINSLFSNLDTVKLYDLFYVPLMCCIVWENIFTRLH